MTVTPYIENHIKRHPSVQPQDIVKLCYQAARGAEHMLSDTDGAKRYFDGEYTAVPPKDSPLYELISPHVCRVDLAAWKHRGLDPVWLFNMFVSSSSVAAESGELFSEYLSCAEDAVKELQPFSFDSWLEYLGEYVGTGMPSVHHSEAYRQAEKPAYCIVNSRFTRIMPILEKMAEKKRGVIAIDGRAASGKSTLAELLAEVTDCGIIHMDDFFLPPELRTAERLATPGGNIHYERFKEEVLPFVSSRREFSYRRFDCSKMALGDEVNVKAADWLVVEGSYSHHPEFFRYADVTVFSDVKKTEQRSRILRRDGEEFAQMFFTRWIPMEEEYFAAFGTMANADMTV